MRFFSVILVLNLFYFVQCAINSDENVSKNRILSRKRRFLLFPEGSSLQLVYDQIIGMVASNNLNIFGITVSLAWQLPHEIHEHKEHEEHGTENHRRNDSVKIYSKPQKDYYNVYYDRKHYHDHRIDIQPKDNSYYGYSKLNWTHASWTKDSNAYNGRIVHRVYPAYRMRRSILNETEQNARHWHSHVKRSINYHRVSRISLYKSIEKYLNAYVFHRRL